MNSTLLGYGPTMPICKSSLNFYGKQKVNFCARSHIYSTLFRDFRDGIKMPFEKTILSVFR